MTESNDFKIENEPLKIAAERPFPKWAVPARPPEIPDRGAGKPRRPDGSIEAWVDPVTGDIRTTSALGLERKFAEAARKELEDLGQTALSDETLVVTSRE